MKFGSYFPNRAPSTFYAMAEDEMALFADMDKLSAKEQAEHEEFDQLMAMLQIALFSISKPEDYVGLFEPFSEAPWSGYLERIHGFMARAGIPMIPLDHAVYAPQKSFYANLAKKIPLVDLVCFFMQSRSNEVIHGDAEAVAYMTNLASKFHFAENAPAFGIDVPATVICEQPLAGNAEAASFFERHDGQVIMKMAGVSGGRNVKAVDSVAEAEEQLAVYPGKPPVLLQQRLPRSEYEEWTADILVTDKSVALHNVRRILLHDGHWIGNHLPCDAELTEAQEAALLTVGRYARHFGAGSPEGGNVGIDYFVGPDGEILVTEINPRWTGGLFPAEVLARIDRQGRDAYAYFEIVKLSEFDAFLDFVGAHMPGEDDTAYATVALGFSPFEVPVEDHLCVYCWVMVLGDFAAFLADANATLGEDGLTRARLVPA